MTLHQPAGAQTAQNAPGAINASTPRAGAPMSFADMVAKPTGGDTGTLLVGGAILGLSVAYSALKWRSAPTVASGRPTRS